MEAREDLLCHGRPAEHVAPLEDEHLPPRTREIRGVREAIVSAPDDDDVVRHGAILCRDGRDGQVFLTAGFHEKAGRCQGKGDYSFI